MKKVMRCIKDNQVLISLTLTFAMILTVLYSEAIFGNVSEEERLLRAVNHFIEMPRYDVEAVLVEGEVKDRLLNMGMEIKGKFTKDKDNKMYSIFLDQGLEEDMSILTLKEDSKKYYMSWGIGDFKEVEIDKSESMYLNTIPNNKEFLTLLKALSYSEKVTTEIESKDGENYKIRAYEYCGIVNLISLYEKVSGRLEKNNIEQLLDINLEDIGMCYIYLYLDYENHLRKINIAIEHDGNKELIQLTIR